MELHVKSASFSRTGYGLNYGTVVLSATLDRAPDAEGAGPDVTPHAMESELTLIVPRSTDSLDEMVRIAVLTLAQQAQVLSDEIGLPNDYE